MKEDIVIKQFEEIGYSETKYSKDLNQLIIERFNEIHLIDKFGIDFDGDIFYTKMNKLPVSNLKKYLKSSTFKPICAYIGNDIMSTEYGNMVLYAVLDVEVYKIVFRIRSVYSSSYTANRIESIRRVRLFYDNESILSHIEDMEPIYGFGACFCPGPILDTEEQKNLYNLQKDLKFWSVDNKINEKWRREEKLSKNKEKLAARKRTFY